MPSVVFLKNLKVTGINSDSQGKLGMPSVLKEKTPA